MAKLKKLLEDVFNDRPQINKFEVVEGVRSFGVVGKQLYNNTNIMEIAKQLSHIAEQAHTHVLGETDDWFDSISVNKNMKALKTNVAEFKKTAMEAHQLNQRLTGLYEDIGHVLNRYYEISEGEEGQLDQEPHHNNDGNVNDLDEGEEENNPPNQIGDEDPSEPNRKNSANVNEINKAMKETYDRISKKPTMRLKDIANNIVGLKPVGGLYKKNK